MQCLDCTSVAYELLFLHPRLTVYAIMQPLQQPSPLPPRSPLVFRVCFCRHPSALGRGRLEAGPALVAARHSGHRGPAFGFGIAIRCDLAIVGPGNPIRPLHPGCTPVEFLRCHATSATSQSNRMRIHRPHACRTAMANIVALANDRSVRRPAAMSCSLDDGRCVQRDFGVPFRPGLCIGSVRMSACMYSAPSQSAASRVQ